MSSLQKYAKIAYDAYSQSTGGRSAITGAELPSFEITPPAVQEAWKAAAWAVIKAAAETVE